MSLAKVNFAMVPPLFLLTISILFQMVSFDIAGNSFWTIWKLFQFFAHYVSILEHFLAKDSSEIWFKI